MNQIKLKLKYILVFLLNLFKYFIKHFDYFLDCYLNFLIDSLYY